MLFKSALVTAASGSIGGMVASHNRGGQYLRARTIPVNANTTQQQAVRNFLSQLSAAWTDTLTAEERDAWSAYASAVPLINPLGDPVFLSGLNHYVRSNVARLQAGLARVDTGPVVYTLPSMTAITVEADASDDEADVSFTNTDEWAIAVGGGLMVSISRPQGQGINYFKGPYRFAGLVAGAVVPPTSPATLTLPFVVSEGVKLFFQARCTTADGRVGSPFRGACSVVA